MMKAKENEPVKYICTMHPDVVSDEPGNCPKCGMKLVPKQGNKMSGRMVLMLLLCLLPVIAVILLPLFGIQINLGWVLFFVLAGCCVLPMLFMRHSHSKR